MGDGEIQVRARAVNHRFVDARVRLPPQLTQHLHQLDQLARKRVERGRVEVTAELSSTPEAQITLDHGRARDAFRELSKLRDELAPDSPLPLSLLSAVPDLFSSTTGFDEALAEASLLEAAEAAFTQLNEMREREGSNLVADLKGRCARLRDLSHAVQALTQSGSEAHAARIRIRVEALLATAPGDLGVDNDRLEMEIALLADRSDVAEEITRLSSHFDQFEALLEKAGPSGRRMDFLVQEMNREVNTIGSKSSDAELSHLVVEIKSEVERVREQIQNIL